MKKVLANVWLKRFFAIIGCIYTVGVGYLCYYSIFYDIHIASRTAILFRTVALSVLALVIMLYSRKQILTRISSFLILPAMLPVVLLWFGEWEIIIPIILTGVVILLLSGAGEGTKTALGTIILLMYIFGALGYFLFTSFFVTTAKEKVVESGESPSGRYRYRVVDTVDSSNGSTAVYVEPNYADVKYKNVTFTLKNMSRIVYLERPKAPEINLEWTTGKRGDITKELDRVSKTIDVNITADKLVEFGYSLESCLEMRDLSIEDRFYLGQTAHDVDPVKLDSLNDEQLAYFGIARDADGRYFAKNPSPKLVDTIKDYAGENIYFTDMNARQLKLFNEMYDYYTLRLNRNVRLIDLTDEQLGALGVTEEGDVMTFNGKVCFRWYVAELDSYFDTESRKLSLDLLG